MEQGLMAYGQAVPVEDAAGSPITARVRTVRAGSPIERPEGELTALVGILERQNREAAEVRGRLFDLVSSIGGGFPIPSLKAEGGVRGEPPAEPTLQRLREAINGYHAIIGDLVEIASRIETLR